MRFFVVYGVISLGAWSACWAQNGKFVPVKPVQSNRPNAAGASLQIGNGKFFSYALPQGWGVGEDGQFALTLVSADTKAITVMVGNAGLPANYAPGRFVY